VHALGISDNVEELVPPLSDLALARLNLACPNSSGNAGNRRAYRRSLRALID